MLKILVIDDERSIRNTLKDILGFEGYHVEIAENGMIGIEMVRSVDYDIILCDIKMPDMDGIEVLEQIMKKSEAPVIMISGHRTIEAAVEAIVEEAVVEAEVEAIVEEAVAEAEVEAVVEEAIAEADAEIPEA